MHKVMVIGTEFNRCMSCSMFIVCLRIGAVYDGW